MSLIWIKIEGGSFLFPFFPPLPPRAWKCLLALPVGRDWHLCNGGGGKELSQILTKSPVGKLAISNLFQSEQCQMLMMDTTRPMCPCPSSKGGRITSTEELTTPQVPSAWQSALAGPGALLQALSRPLPGQSKVLKLPRSSVNRITTWASLAKFGIKPTATSPAAHRGSRPLHWVHRL